MAKVGSGKPNSTPSLFVWDGEGELSVPDEAQPAPVPHVA